MTEHGDEQSGLAETFRDYLKQHRQKQTSERLSIASAVMEVRGVFSAKDVMMLLKEQGKRQSRGTIYSTIRLLAEAGLVLQLPQWGEARYLTSVQAATYAVCNCRLCGTQTLYRQSLRLKELKQQGVHRYGLVQPLLVYNGLCRECSSKQNRTL